MISLLHVVPIINVICMIIKTRTAAWLFVENLRYLHNPNTLSWNWPQKTFSQNLTHIFRPTPNHILAVPLQKHILSYFWHILLFAFIILWKISVDDQCVKWLKCTFHHYEKHIFLFRRDWGGKNLRENYGFQPFIRIKPWTAQSRLN